jgi:predicted MFS family arabinose efflux permease
MENRLKTNYFIYYIQQILLSCVSLLITGSVIQNFLLENGGTENSVSLYVSLLQVLQVIVMLMFSKKMENLKHFFRVMFLVYFMQTFLFVTMIYMSIRHNGPADRRFIILFSVSMFVGVFQSIRDVLSYKMPYYIMDMKDYGRVSGMSGVLMGVFGVAFSAAFSFFIAKNPYYSTMAVFSGIGLVFNLIISFLFGAYKNIQTSKSQNQTKEIHIFKYKPFYELIIPNLLRGISNGIFLLLATIALTCNVVDNVGIGIMVTISQVATIIGCFAFSMLSGKIKDGKLICFCSVIFGIIMPFLFWGKSQKVFLVLYLITYLLYICVNYAIPVLIARNIDFQCIGQYSAWRIAIHMLGTAIGSAIVPVLLKTIQATGCFIICGTTLLVCGVCYYLFEKKNSKERE